MFRAMRRRTRRQRWLKWCFTVPLAVAVGGLTVGVVGPVRYRIATSDGVFGVVLDSGWASAGYQESPQIPPWFRAKQGPDILDSIGRLERRGWGRFRRRAPDQFGPDWLVAVPLWIPSVVLLLPTALLWYRDRRFPSGHCQRCGQSLIGVRAKRCPECGLEIPLPRGGIRAE